MNVIKNICVFCGSSRGSRPEYEAAARELGRAIVRRGYGLVYGGAHVGLMGFVADEVLANGGEATGVIPEILMAKELAHPSLTKLLVVKSMHERKAKMEELSDAFVAMPGGFGTFEEFCEIVTWAQLGLHRKPCGILNVGSYYDALLAQFDHAVEEAFISKSLGEIVQHSPGVEDLLDLLERFEPHNVDKWIDRRTS
ncbi:MAG: TIGR00730 family Rossman fold protein [Candidatus Obscuribacterales bacterium]|nr:TIGR00730 family Rossman fold protein [Candidatus Obscuribacterales bacterium]